MSDYWTDLAVRKARELDVRINPLRCIETWRLAEIAIEYAQARITWLRCSPPDERTKRQELKIRAIARELEKRGI